MTTLQKFIENFFQTLYPNLCFGCNLQPKTRDSSFCVQCLHDLPYTDHFETATNIVTNHFKGRVPLDHGAAILIFTEGGIVQNLLHQLKYKGKREIGEIMGEIAGKKILSSPLFHSPDIIIPVPIHTKKQVSRGYNQSTIFGKAIEKIIHVPCKDNILTKKKETKSQTGKSRTDRIQNVSDVFEMKNAQSVSNKHVLLVDDVVTTGATLEACCLEIIKAGASKISIVSIAAAV